MAKLMNEVMFENYEVLIEQKNEASHKSIYVQGPYIVAGVRNANGRTYTEELMDSTVAQYDTDFIQKNRAYGELNHPTHTDIDPKQACDLCVELIKKGKTWIGKSKILSSSPAHGILGTPNGDIVASMLQHGGIIGKSTRGVGEISEGNIIDKIYKMIAIDTVVDPSGPGCFVDGIFESKNFMITNHGDIVEVAYEKYAKGLSNIPAHSIKSTIGKAYVENLFESFLQNLNKRVVK
jgi:hypothetical protein